MAMAFISIQKTVAKNNDNGQDNYSFKGLALRDTLSKACLGYKWFPQQLIVQFCNIVMHTRD